jgi:hypothetical protein
MVVLVAVLIRCKHRPSDERVSGIAVNQKKQERDMTNTSGR